MERRTSVSQEMIKSGRSAISRAILRGSVALMLQVAARLARAGRTDVLESAGFLLARRRRVMPSHDPKHIAELWQRAFPSTREVPVTSVDRQTSTAYAEIHTRCPLRGTGQVETCHKMMAFDRGFAKRAGARFVVLQSQAEPGVTVCKVALRPAHLPAEDLVPAHLRAGRSAASADAS